MNSGPVSAAPEGIDLRRVLGILGKWRWLIVVLTGVSVLTAAFLSEFVLPKVYQATATLDVSYAAPSQNQAGSTQNQQGLQGVIQSVATLPQNTLETYQWQVSNPVVLQATAQALQAKGISLSTTQLAKMIKASVVTNTNLINVSVQDTSPQVAATVANALTGAYLQTVQQQDHQKLSQAVSFLQDQAASVQQQLLQATQALAAATLNSANSPTQTAELQADQQQLASLQSQLTQAEIKQQGDQAALQAFGQQLASTPAQIQEQEPAPTSSTSGTSSSSSGKGTGTATITVTIPNPQYQQLQQQIAAEQVTLAKDQATVEGVRTAIGAVTTDVTKLSAANVTKASSQALQSQVDELTQTYQTLMQNLTEAQVADSMSLGNTVVTVTAPATQPVRPIKPNKKLNVALAMLLGLIVSLGLAFVLEQLDNTVKSTDDVERVTKGPTLAVIPHFE